jgi:hypothetical protein
LDREERTKVEARSAEGEGATALNPAARNAISRCIASPLARPVSCLRFAARFATQAARHDARDATAARSAARISEANSVRSAAIPELQGIAAQAAANPTSDGCLGAGSSAGWASGRAAIAAGKRGNSRVADRPIPTDFFGSRQPHGSVA